MRDKNQSVVIIEDELQDAEFTIRALKQVSKQLNIIHISDVDDLISFDFESKKIAMIFLDMKMPKIAGLELLQLIKNNPDVQTIPIIVLSSSSMPKQEAQAKQMGVFDFIVKPINIDQYYAVVKNAYLSVMKK